MVPFSFVTPLPCFFLEEGGAFVFFFFFFWIFWWGFFSLVVSLVFGLGVFLLGLEGFFFSRAAFAGGRLGGFFGSFFWNVCVFPSPEAAP